MGFRPEPILDIARGLSAFTAAYILGNQVLVVMREMFVDRCAHCRGAGRVICPHCGGTKTMRNRPGEFHVAQMDVVDRRPKDMTQCIHCGPLVVYDLVKEADDDEDEALDIMDNMKDAFAGRMRQIRMPILAGTVPCPKCFNFPRVRRHTPNFARIFKLEEPWWWTVSARAGAFRGTSPIRKHHYVEYPSRAPHADELDPEHIIGTMKADYELTMEQAEAKRAPELDENEMAPGPKTPEQEAAEKARKKRTHGWSARGLMSDVDIVTKYVDDTDSSDSEDEE